MHGGQQEQETYDQNKFRKFTDLDSHWSDLKKDEGRLKRLEEVRQWMVKFMGARNTPSLEELQSIYGRVIINSFCILDGKLNPIGQGVYLAASIFDHSCCPNAFIYFEGKKAVVRSLVEWSKLDLTRVCISYVDVAEFAEVRVEFLRRQYYFTCDCRFCRDVNRLNIERATQCGNSSCSEPVPIPEDDTERMSPCPACGCKSFGPKHAQQISNVILETYNELDRLKADGTSLETCEALDEKQKTLLHDLNVARVKTRAAYFDAAVAEREWEKAVNVAKKNQAGIKFYYGENHPLYGRFLMDLARAEVYLGQTESALSRLQESRDSLVLGVGPSHPIVTRDLSLVVAQAKGEVPIHPKTRKVEKGEVILSCRPFVYALNESVKGNYCEYCFVASRKTLVHVCCPKCRQVFYCSEKCRQKGRALHDFECQELGRLYAMDPPTLARLLVRLVCKLRNGGYREQDTYDEGKSRKFTDLLNHWSDVCLDESRQKHLAELREWIKAFLGEENTPSAGELQSMYGRVIINSFSILDERLNPIGQGVYLAASIFDHSCLPNAFVTFRGNEVVIRSLVDWPELDLSQVRISYIDTLNCVDHRRSTLYMNYYFWCDCVLCRDESKKKVESSTNCGNPSCPEPVPIPDDEDSPVGPCPRCGFADFEPDLARRVNEANNNTRDAFKEMREDAICPVRSVEIMQEQGTLLHPLNLWRIKALDGVFTSGMSNGLWTRAWTYGKMIIKGMRYYYGPQHPVYGLFIMNLARMEIYLHLLRAALWHLQEIENILQIGMGAEHHLVENELSSLLALCSGEVNVDLQRKVMQFDIKGGMEKVRKKQGVRVPYLKWKDAECEVNRQIQDSNPTKEMEEQEAEYVKKVDSVIGNTIEKSPRRGNSRVSLNSWIETMAKNIENKDAERRALLKYGKKNATEEKPQGKFKVKRGLLGKPQPAEEQQPAPPPPKKEVLKNKPTRKRFIIATEAPSPESDNSKAEINKPIQKSPPGSRMLRKESGKEEKDVRRTGEV
ncbi:uncharacterized protein LOC143026359 isoform X2 [Oratosquilla oratoria]|uniref:uncharacterized protein LOC143026359 isoform X2 n=1 Tax=Oratosquilla oratoria TaxID=337810 RepID=UPI003F764FFC